MRLRISARKSALARIQAFEVGAKIRQNQPGLEIVFQFRDSQGDFDQDTPLWKTDSKGLFTADFRQDLLKDETDLVVHSWKDLPTEQNPETYIAATLPRADARDMLLIKKDSLGKPFLHLLSSSPRRAYHIPLFLRNALPWSPEKIQFFAVRGNIATRLKKFLDPESDGGVVAKAALDRLLATADPELSASKELIKKLFDCCQWMILPLSACPPAPAQGALGLEILRSRNDLATILALVNCSDSFGEASEEREILAHYGGGCHQKIGIACLNRPYGRLRIIKGITLQGQVLDEHTLHTPHPPGGFAKPGEVYPLSAKQDQLFDREPRPLPTEELNRYNALVISRSNAWPEAVSADAAPGSPRVLWTSGLKTWQDLARRGLWVNGSFEGLGESQDMGLKFIEQILPKPLRWAKFSHQASSNQRFPLLATYQLIPRSHKVDWQAKHHFFWMSGSVFRQALSEDGSLASRGHHACGPGETWNLLRRELKAPAQLRVYLNYEDWKKELGLPSQDLL